MGFNSAFKELITFVRIFLKTHVGKMKNISIYLRDYNFKAYCLVYVLSGLTVKILPLVQKT